VAINQSDPYSTLLTLNSKPFCFARAYLMAKNEAELKENSDETSFCFRPNTI